MFSIEELKECLRRLKGLASYGGDVFFAGIARTMVAKPFVPQSYRLDLSLARKMTLGQQQEAPSKEVLD